jgi:hypothetical protein
MIVRVIKKNDLQEQIRRILKEETKINIYLRRRLGVIDNEFYRLMKEVYMPDNICRHITGEDLLDRIIQSVIDFMYFNHFSNLDDNGKLWNEIYNDIENYIKDKYGEKIKEYFHINCGD